VGESAHRLRIVRFVLSQRSKRARPGPAAHGGPSNWRSPVRPVYGLSAETYRGPLAGTFDCAHADGERAGVAAMAHDAFGGGTGVSDVARRAFGHDGGRASQVGIVATAKTVVVGPAELKSVRPFPAPTCSLLYRSILVPGGIMLIHASKKEGPPEASAHSRRRCSARQHSSLADGRPVDRNAIGAGREAQEDQQASGASRRTHGNRQAKTHLIEIFHTNDSRPLEHGKSDVSPAVSSTTTAEAAHR
jgi:hypothetical protein